MNIVELEEPTQSLSDTEGSLERTDVGVSSLMDTWLLLRDIELNGERNRGMYVLKSRGMAHSNQIREFVLTNKGIRLLKVYLGVEGVLTGSARGLLRGARSTTMPKWLRTGSIVHPSCGGGRQRR